MILHSHGGDVKPDTKADSYSFAAANENVQAENTESKAAMASRAGSLYYHTVMEQTFPLSVARHARAMLKNPENGSSGLGKHVVVVTMGMLCKS